jgi:signal transduction histidine kinase/ActR/RegA family two-component response regulator
MPLLAFEVRAYAMGRPTREIYESQARVLSELTRSSLLASPDAGLNVKPVLATVAATLDVARTSLWHVGDTGGIECYQLYEASSGQYASGMKLASEVAPRYFAALAANETIVADDALRDPRTMELAPDYLRPLGISSMLDAPVFVNNKLAGVLCSEHVGPARRWTHAEESFAVAVANLLALMIAQRDRVRGERSLAKHVQELRCLYRVLELATHDSRPVDVICEEIAGLLPGCLLHVDDAVARIVLSGNEYRSRNWRQPAVELRKPVRVTSEQIGGVEIGYLAPKPDQNEGHGAFLAQEATLAEAVATHIGHMLNNRQLTEMLRQSERLSAIGALTAGVAHDFNNILQVMFGTMEALIAALAGNRELEPLARMGRQAVERGAELTRRLLAFSRQSVLEPTTVDAGRLVREMVDFLRRTLGMQIEVRLVAPSNLWLVVADARQLENALLNLCFNARDAMPHGGTLTIELANTSLRERAEVAEDVVPGDYVMMAISDTGTGMTPDVLARAVEPFFTTKDVGLGSGLGLSMVYGFARQSGGHLRITSEPGQGTNVRLYLPKAQHQAIRADAAVELAAISAGAGGRILVVEDDSMVRQHAVMQLASLGYDVAQAASGSEALELLSDGREIDLLFTDIMMPGGMDGVELAARVRELRPRLPVVFTSGYAESAVVWEGKLREGMTILTKPYRRQELADTIREALENRTAV